MLGRSRWERILPGFSPSFDRSVLPAPVPCTKKLRPCRATANLAEVQLPGSGATLLYITPILLSRIGHSAANNRQRRSNRAHVSCPVPVRCGPASGDGPFNVAPRLMDVPMGGLQHAYPCNHGRGRPSADVFCSPTWGELARAGSSQQGRTARRPGLPQAVAWVASERWARRTRRAVAEPASRPLRPRACLICRFSGQWMHRARRCTSLRT
jgi:hypothetical protein